MRHPQSRRGHAAGRDAPASFLNRSYADSSKGPYSLRSSMSASIAGSITLVKCSERSSGMGGGVLALRKKEESKDFIGWEG